MKPFFAAAAALVIAATVASCGAPAPNQPAAASTSAPAASQPIGVASFNAAQQADIRAVVRDYLLRDPAVLEDALQALAAQKTAQRRTTMETDTRSFAFGPRDAPITIVEFFDYRCPYCHAALEWINGVMARRRDVRIIFREYPILTRQSEEAARAAMASIRQNRYLPFHRALMGFPGDLTSAQIDTIARQSGVDVARMRRDMADPAIDQYLRQTLELANEAQVNGTPSFFINGRYVSGWPGPEDLDRIVNEAAAAAQRDGGRSR